MICLIKLVGSVSLNIINTGRDFHSAFPDPLKSIYSHPSAAPQFTGIFRAVTRAQSDILITSYSFPGDQAVWLTTHSHGILEISLGGQIVLEEHSGTNSIRVIFTVHNICPACPDRDGDLKTRSIKVATIVK
jgi:hypothetical protein